MQACPPRNRTENHVVAALILTFLYTIRTHLLSRVALKGCSRGGSQRASEMAACRVYVYALFRAPAIIPPRSTGSLIEVRFLASPRSEC